MGTRATILDIAKANGSDAVVGLIDETTKAHPEIAQLPSRTIKGVGYKTLVRKNLPTGTIFRNANQGSQISKAEYINRYVETFILNPRWEADKAIADRYEDGPTAFIALEAEAQTEWAMASLSQQFYYGNSPAAVTAGLGDAKGFPGLIDSVDPTMVYDAGGTTGGTGSSVWFVKYGPKDVQWVWGENGILQVNDVRTETLFDASTPPLPFTGYVQDMLAYPGLQVGSIRSLARIKKLTADVGKGLTDAVITAALAKFEAGITPDAIFMSRRSLAQLQTSRTVTIFTGAGGKATSATENVAPRPTESMGVPIFVTDAIKDTEPLTL